MATPEPIVNAQKPYQNPREYDEDHASPPPAAESLLPLTARANQVSASAIRLEDGSDPKLDYNDQKSDEESKADHNIEK